MPDTIDINITPVIETVDLTIQPNLTTINVNTVTGGGGGAVTSVNTLVGDVVLNQDNILDGTTNKQYSLTEKNKLSGIAAGAEVNVNADWNATTGDAQILNKPSIPAAQVNSDWNATSGVEEILNKPTIPAEQIQSDWTQANTSALDYIKNKPTIPSSSTFVPYTGATANVDLGTHKLLAEDLDINHTSGSGDAATITKGGSGEALKVVKTSGSGNAASITGGVTLLDELHLTTDLADAYIASAPTWNAKQNALSYTPYRNLQTSQTAFTGSTAETILFTATIPANTFNANDIIHFYYNVYKTTVLGSYVLRLKINTSNTLTGAATIGTYNGALTTQIALMHRNLHLFGGNLYGYPAVSLTLISDIVGSVGTIASNTLNPANQFFIFGTVTLANASDNIIGTMFKISN
jgi:hypothetical protein